MINAFNKQSIKIKDWILMIIVLNNRANVLEFHNKVN